MERSKSAWLEGPGDLREAEVTDVPVQGASVLVRGLSAKYSAEVTSQVKLVSDGDSQVAKIDKASMELLQFMHGVIDPVFTRDEVSHIQNTFGPAFQKVIAKIDELSGIDKDAIEKAEARFPVGGAGAEGLDGPGVASGNGGPDVHARAGA